ncbi:MAG: VWA domain-containing protein [Trueperaceae bacterium]|nr:VWA domain-containing protein [Trueperaceae bacterium]
MTYVRHLRHRALLVLVLLVFGSAASAQVYVELILDASGSMFNRLDDGRYRIVAAKDALSTLISSLPDNAELNVGLRVYGSQLQATDEGSCQDSELFVPLEGFQRQDLLDEVRTTQARGSTPIAYSLEQAAADFPAEGRKVIVLVTDGEESCGGDVRAVAERLSAQGVEIDLRIVGIDLAERAIDSFEGLGTFENARSAADLAAALGRAVETVVQPQTETYPVTVVVTRQDEPVGDDASVDLVNAVSEERYSLSRTEPGEFNAEVPAATYTAIVQDAASDEPQRFSGLNVTPEGDNTFRFDLAPIADVTLTVSPSEPVAGSMVTVSFENAPAEGDENWITVVPQDAPDDVYLSWSYVSGSSGEVSIRTPAEPATLEARYLLDLPNGGSRVIGRSEPFTSQPINVTLEVPNEVTAGSSFSVSWQGPGNPGDYLTIVAEGAPAGAYGDYAYTDEGNPLSLRAPVEAGAYEVRYQSDYSDEVFASAPVSVVAADYAVDAPDEVVTGAAFQVMWQGPNNQGDYITIVEAGAEEGAYTSYAYTRSGNPVTITAPLEPGEYEVRYTTEQTSPNPTLASTPITVTQADYAVDAPDEVTMGSSFEVMWQGPNNQGDYITIVEAGASEGSYMSYAYTSSGNPVTITAPLEPGEYEVRYTTEQGSNPTLASTPITVTSATYSLDAPDTVAAGETFEVSWEGPNNQGDYITIVEAGASEGSYMSYAYTSSGDPVTLTAPSEPGEYEVRYTTEQASPNPTLASTPITVE